jgi:hypothetical protein
LELLVPVRGRDGLDVNGIGDSWAASGVWEQPDGFKIKNDKQVVITRITITETEK